MAVYSIFGGCFCNNFRNKISVVIHDMQSLVGFSVIPECMT